MVKSPYLWKQKLSKNNHNPLLLILISPFLHSQILKIILSLSKVILPLLLQPVLRKPPRMNQKALIEAISVIQWKNIPRRSLSLRHGALPLNHIKASFIFLHSILLFLTSLKDKRDYHHSRENRDYDRNR